MVLAITTRDRKGRGVGGLVLALPRTARLGTKTAPSTEECFGEKESSHSPIAGNAFCKTGVQTTEPRAVQERTPGLRKVLGASRSLFALETAEGARCSLAAALSVQMVRNGTVEPLRHVRPSQHFAGRFDWPALALDQSDDRSPPAEAAFEGDDVGQDGGLVDA